jgi:putative endonuclease
LIADGDCVFEPKSLAIPSRTCFGIYSVVQYVLMSESFFVYILTNKPRGVLYIGFTSDLKKRIWEHKNKLVDGFTKKYNLTRLVYYESGDDGNAVLERERQLKNWHRDWKINQIEKDNPSWDDLYDSI